MSKSPPHAPPPSSPPPLGLDIVRCITLLQRKNGNLLHYLKNLHSTVPRQNTTYYMRVYRFPHVAAFYSSCRAFCHECRSLIGFPPHNSVIVAKLCTLLNKRTAASWRFRSVCEKDLDILKQLDYSLSISMRDSLLGPSSTTNFLTCFVFKIQLR